MPAPAVRKRPAWNQNSTSHSEEAVAKILAMTKPLEPDLFIAGPAFNAGRYGVACGTICRAVENALHIPVLTGMYEENPGVDMFRKDLIIVKTKNSAAGMRQAVPVIRDLGIKLVNGEEITTSFSTEGGIVFSMDELYFNKESEEFVETLEDVVAYRILLTDLLHLFETNLELANWGRVIHQIEYRRLHRSHKERLTLSARERYEAFRQQFPQVCQRAQLGYIASYLGITLSTLSRLRGGKK